MALMEFVIEKMSAIAQARADRWALEHPLLHLAAERSHLDCVDLVLIRRPPFDFPWGVRGMDIEDVDGHHLRFSGDGAEENRSP